MRGTLRRSTIYGLALLLLGVIEVAGSSFPATVGAPQMRGGLHQFPVSNPVFIENRGQWPDPSVHYVLRGGGVNAAFTPYGPRFQLLKAVTKPQTTGHECGHSEFVLRFDGARPVAPVGREKAAGVFHFHRGGPGRWRENVPTWQQVVYPNLYDGIDLRAVPQKRGLKYEFAVAPGADWRQIRFHYDGIAGLELRGDGAVLIHPADSSVRTEDNNPPQSPSKGGLWAGAIPL